MLSLRLFILFILPFQLFPSAFCTGKRVTLVAANHTCTVKFESEDFDMYLDAGMVKNWATGNLGVENKKYRGEPSKNDSIAYRKLIGMKAGDTVVISDLSDPSRLTRIIELQIRNLFNSNNSVQMQIYDKDKKEFITQVHCRVFKIKSSHGRVGNCFALYNAAHKHDKWDMFFDMDYDWKGPSRF